MALDDDIALLSQAPLLAALGVEPLRLLAFSAESRTVRTGDLLFREGQAADCGYVVVDGAFLLTDAAGLTPGRLARRGALLGEMALMVETIRPATAIAQEPATAMRIPRPLFRRVLGEFPEAAARVQQDLRRKMDETVRGLARVRDALGAIPG